VDDDRRQEGAQAVEEVQGVHEGRDALAQEPQSADGTGPYFIGVRGIPGPLNVSKVSQSPTKVPTLRRANL
jgi:hypothetical protein